MPGRVLRRLLVAAPMALAAVALLGLLGLPALAAEGGSGLSPLPPSGQSPNGQDIYNLYLAISIPAVIIFLGVEAALAYTIIKYRRSRLPAGYVPPQWHGSTRLEVVWTLIPLGIVLAIAIASFFVLQEDFVKPADAVTYQEIKVTGHQFGWDFEYPQGFTVHSEGTQVQPLVVPEKRLTRLRLEGRDVIHGFWVPELTGKQDLVPGYDNYTWIKPVGTGTWNGQCTELCGVGHSTMLLKVRAVSQADFNAFVSDQKANAAKPKPAAGSQPAPSPSASAGASPSPSASPSSSPRPTP